jgi:hypothetical protein
MTGFTASLLKILTIWPVSFVWRAALDNRIPLRKICVDSACQDIGQGIGQEVCQEEVCQEEGVRCQEKKCQEVVRNFARKFATGSLPFSTTNKWPEHQTTVHTAVVVVHSPKIVVDLTVRNWTPARLMMALCWDRTKELNGGMTKVPATNNHNTVVEYTTLPSKWPTKAFNKKGGANVNTTYMA